MAGVNKVILVGNLGNDPETRYTADGKAISNITVATSETWKDKTSGEKKEKTEWHRVAFFGRLAEIVGQYLRKGAKVYVEGKLETKKWQAKDGSDRYTTSIIANELQMLDSRGDKPQSNASTAQPQSNTPPPSVPQGGVEDFDDDIPF